MVCQSYLHHRRIYRVLAHTIEKEESENRKKILVARQGMWYYSKDCISISSVKLLIEWHMSENNNSWLVRVLMCEILLFWF